MTTLYRSTYRRSRGRPRKELPQRDLGTPELIYKRASGLTTEALDLCLEREIITPVQHWCGIHFRWLYTIRFGAPGVRALDTRHLGGLDIIPEDDPRWRSAREEEYSEAAQLLGPKRQRLLLQLAIHNEYPRYLRIRPENFSPILAAAFAHDQALLRETLNALASSWCKKAKNP